MELGIGKLQWTPRTFWGSTVIELEAAANGLAKLNGAEGEEEISDIPPLGRDEFERLKEKLGG